MPLSLTRRLLLSAVAIGSGSLVDPLKSFGENKKNLPPCKAERSFGVWFVKIWETGGGIIEGAISLSAGLSDNIPQNQCVFTKEYPSLYIQADPKGKAFYNIGFVCSNSLLPQKFDFTLRTADGKELTARPDVYVQPIEKTTNSGVWLTATQFITGQGECVLRKGGQLSLTVKGDANTTLALNFDGGGFADAWQFLISETSKLQAMRNKQCGGCFITAACCQYFGFDDDCFELRTLRAFRDGPMQRMPGGPADIARYYECAPIILRSIRAAADFAILRNIYFSYILPSAVAAHFGLNTLARTRYTKMMRELEARYCVVDRSAMLHSK